MEGHGFAVLALPINMTDILQPVDVVLGGPLKAGQRALRVEMLYTYHQEFVQDAEAAQRVSADAELPLYAPPVPSLATCIAVQSKVFAVNFTTPEFAASIVRVFQNVGLTPLDNGSYIQYTSHESSIRLRNKKLFKHLGARYYVRDGDGGTCDNKKLFADGAVFDDMPFDHLADRDAEDGLADGVEAEGDEPEAAA